VHVPPCWHGLLAQTGVLLLIPPLPGATRESPVAATGLSSSNTARDRCGRTGWRRGTAGWAAAARAPPPPSAPSSWTAAAAAPGDDRTTLKPSQMFAPRGPLRPCRGGPGCDGIARAALRLRSLRGDVNTTEEPCLAYCDRPGAAGPSAPARRRLCAWCVSVAMPGLTRPSRTGRIPAVLLYSPSIDTGPAAKMPYSYSCTVPAPHSQIDRSAAGWGGGHGCCDAACCAVCTQLLYPAAVRARTTTAVRL
jgi:hypothetical protein